MYEYMKALYLRFFREPECNELRQEIYKTQQELRARLGREETALESFVAGFQLAWGMVRELEDRGLYSFDQEESERIRQESAQQRVPKI